MCWSQVLICDATFLSLDFYAYHYLIDFVSDFLSWNFNIYAFLVSSLFMFYGLALISFSCNLTTWLGDGELILILLRVFFFYLETAV